MTLQDVGNCVVVSPLHEPGRYSASRDGNAVGTAKYAYAFVILSLGTLHAMGSVAFHIEQASTSGGTYTACKKLGTDIDATTAAFSSGDWDTEKIIAIDLNNTSGFLRARCVDTGGQHQYYSASLVLMPYVTNTISDDASAASAPLFNI